MQKGQKWCQSSCTSNKHNMGLSENKVTMGKHDLMVCHHFLCFMVISCVYPILRHSLIYQDTQTLKVPKVKVVNDGPTCQLLSVNGGSGIHWENVTLFLLRRYALLSTIWSTDTGPDLEFLSSFHLSRDGPMQRPIHRPGSRQMLRMWPESAAHS